MNKRQVSSFLLKTEQIIEQSNTNITILSAGLFFKNILMEAGQVI